jgi:hypothetical protein
VIRHGNGERSFAMSAAMALRDDFNGPELNVLAKGSRDPVQLRRLLALAEIYDGGARKRCGADRRGSARIGLQSLRDWVLRFNAGGPEALIDAKTAGKRATRPSAPRDQRTRSAWLFGAILPTRRQGRGPGPAPLQYQRP